MTVKELIVLLQALTDEEQDLSVAVIDHESYHPVEASGIKVGDKQPWEHGTPQRFLLIS